MNSCTSTSIELFIFQATYLYWTDEHNQTFYLQAVQQHDDYVVIRADLRNPFHINTAGKRSHMTLNGSIKQDLPVIYNTCVRGQERLVTFSLRVAIFFKTKSATPNEYSLSNYGILGNLVVDLRGEAAGPYNLTIFLVKLVTSTVHHAYHIPSCRTRKYTDLVYSRLLVAKFKLRMDRRHFILWWKIPSSWQPKTAAVQQTLTLNLSHCLGHVSYALVSPEILPVSSAYVLCYNFLCTNV